MHGYLSLILHLPLYYWNNLAEPMANWLLPFRYFGQAFGAKKPYPDKYDLLMDIATEEFSHLEIVGATIQMLLTGINGDLKDAAENSEIMQLLNGKAAKEEMIHQGMVAPQFFVGSAGGPAYTNSQGVPWTAAYINGDVQGDLTSELRSNMGAETRAKMVYEYLLQFTEDPYVKETLQFLMTREVAHFQMFEAALRNTTEFPSGNFTSDPRYSNLYFNMSSGNDFRGPWNQGPTTQLGETFQFIEDPIKHVMETNGLLEQEPEGTKRTPEIVDEMNRQMSGIRSEEINLAAPIGEQQWNEPMTEKGEIQNARPNQLKVVKPINQACDTSVRQEVKSGLDIVYYTDPLCCCSWAMRQQLAQFKTAWEGTIQWRYCMGGLLPSWNQYQDSLNAISRPAQMGPVWMQASELTGVPMPHRIWVENPPVSSYPACIAVKCAMLQSPVLGELYFHYVQEASWNKV